MRRPRQKRPPVRPARPALTAIQPVVYVLLLALLFASGGLALLRAFGLFVWLWDAYGSVYLFLMLGYSWFVLILVCMDDMRPRVFPAYAGERMTVLIPCYNESPALLKRCVKSVVAARGNKRIIIIDDGSSNGVRPYARTLAREHGIRIHCFNRNRGKREALHYAVTRLLEDEDFIITIDSDTVLDKDALIRVVEPLKEPDIAASTGDVRLLNEHQNLLTTMIASYYWIGLNVYKKAQSALGTVVCCSGCLAAYRSDVLRANIRKFVKQEFFGERCTHSEDRHLTNLVLQRDYRVVYVPAAISHTETPATLKGFLKQQQRWKRGYTRECLYTLSYAWRNRPLLFLQILLWDLTIPFFSFGLMLAIVGTLLTRPWAVLALVPSWTLCMLVRNIPVLFHARGKLRGLFLYMFFYEFFLYWQSIYALFTVRNKSWITR
jgi:hyaluronan synthase